MAILLYMLTDLSECMMYKVTVFLWQFEECTLPSQMEGIQIRPRRALLPPPLDSLHCGLPSPAWPSDHISLLCDFQMIGPPTPATAPMSTPLASAAHQAASNRSGGNVGTSGLLSRVSAHSADRSGVAAGQSAPGPHQQIATAPSGSASVPIGAVHSFQHARFVD